MNIKEKWLKELKDNDARRIPIVLVGTKSDARDIQITAMREVKAVGALKIVDSDDGRQLAREIGDRFLLIRTARRCRCVH